MAADVAKVRVIQDVGNLVDRTGRVFETTESLLPIVPSGGIMFEF